MNVLPEYRECWMCENCKDKHVSHGETLQFCQALSEELSADYSKGALVLIDNNANCEHCEYFKQDDDSEIIYAIGDENFMHICGEQVSREEEYGVKAGRDFPGTM